MINDWNILDYCLYYNTNILKNVQELNLLYFSALKCLLKLVQKTCGFGAFFEFT